MRNITFAVGFLSALFICLPAEATIVYTDLVPDPLVRTRMMYDEWGNLIEVGMGHYLIDLNADGKNELNIHESDEPQAGGPRLLSYWADAYPDVELVLAQDGHPAMLAADAEIGYSGNYGRDDALNVITPIGGWGNWWGEGFLGIQFTIDSNTHYGWAHLTVSDGVMIHGFAYESTASKAIRAGAVPEPLSVILLLIGLALCRAVIPGIAHP